VLPWTGILTFQAVFIAVSVYLVCPTGALHEKHNITEVQEYLNKPEIVKVIQYSSMVVYGIAEELGDEIYKGI
jgi:hypothetical protein